MAGGAAGIEGFCLAGAVDAAGSNEEMLAAWWWGVQ